MEINNFKIPTTNYHILHDRYHGYSGLVTVTMVTPRPGSALGAAVAVVSARPGRGSTSRPRRGTSAPGGRRSRAPSSYVTHASWSLAPVTNINEQGV